MLSILGRRGRLCDTVSRRELLSIGSLSLLGLSLPQVLQRRAAAEEVNSRKLPGFGRAESVILVYLQGSPSHIDLWDPKPDAPTDIRGEFSPIATSAPGIQLGEVLPKLALQAKHFSLIRSIGVDPKGLRNHGAAIYMLMTGHDPTNFSPTGLAVPPSRNDLPSMAANVAKHRPPAAGRFANVAVCGPVKEAREMGVGQSAGLLGAAYDPFTMYDDPTQPIKIDGLALPEQITLARLQGRAGLKATVEAELRGTLQPSPGSPTAPFDAYYAAALSLIQSDGAVRAFRLEEESDSLRDHYGRHRFGQSCLLARRLVEAGTRFVQITWPARSDDEPMAGPDGSWDTHRNNFPMLRDHRCPVFDPSLAALIEDLAARGLLESTLVVAVGEFGRSPKIGAPTTDNVGPGGRDHWPECYSALIAGGGVRPGQVYGESDRYGAYPKTDRVHPYDLIATIYHAIGVDHSLEYLDTLNRPRRLVQNGGPIVGLF